jgi:hypothetical protein
MNESKRAMLTCVIALALAVGLLLTRPAAVCAQAGNAAPSSGASFRPPWLRLEDKAVAARAGDEASVRALAEEVLNQAHGLPQAPSEVLAPIVDRLVYAEVRYRAGTGAPVEETNVVPMINGLVATLGLPNYATVDSPQVRFVRMATLRLTPKFMGEGALRPAMKVGEEINHSISPLQAVHLALCVIEQKLFNPDYQLGPGEWEAHQASLDLARWQAHQQASQAGLTGNPSNQPHLEVLSNPKAQTLLNAIGSAQANMASTDALTMAHRTLDVLGIERQLGGE